MEKKIISVVKYFSFFAYQPTSQEIHTFLQAKISKNSLNKELDRMVKQKVIAKYKMKNEKYAQYTPPQYSIGRKILNIKYQISKRKLENWRYRAYIKLLSFFSQIELVGLSGSISMMNAGENDDVDLFVITAKNRLFTGRFIALVLAQVLGSRRSRNSNNGTMKQWSNRVRNKICLNLFFDENNLKVPKFKQTEFVGHEVLQMKPIINKDQTYERFLEANSWMFRLFPNAKSQINFKYQLGVIPAKAGIQTKNTWIPSYEGMTRLFVAWNLGFRISNKIESLLKKLQLKLINRHKITEIITSTQLWFHPDDFEKKIKKQSRTTS